jgi:hydrogenase-4 component F
MIAVAFILLPWLGCLCLLPRRATRWAAPVLVAVGLLMSGLAVVQYVRPGQAACLAGYLRIDSTARLFLSLINPVFLGIAVYVLTRVNSTPFLRTGIRRFSYLCLLFLSAANLVLISNHLILGWIALEATTLAAVPLIVRTDVPDSRRAAWRYLLFSSVGLGLAWLGFLCLSKAVGGAEAAGPFFDRLPELVRSATEPWSKLGLSLVLLGLGTKLGLAPMYNWLPEVYDEAPPSVAAMLAAIQFNCALVLLFRIVGACRTSHPDLISHLLVAMGGLSMMVSTFNIIATRNVKRLIAYASINHAGVIAIGLGIGGVASYGLLLYAISNAFIKVILFLAVGKIKAHYRTKDTRKIPGLLRDLPYSGAFLMVGTFALLGFPPFGSFFGELLILSALVGSGHLFVFGGFCVLIIMTFVAMGRTIFPMIWSEPKEARSWPKQTLLSASPKIGFLAALVVLGVYIPPSLNALIKDVAQTLDRR